MFKNVFVLIVMTMLLCAGLAMHGIAYQVPGQAEGVQEPPDPDAPFGYADDKLLARGDGFQVMGEQVREFKKLMEEATPIITTEREYTRMLAAMYAAALESRSLGIVSFEESVEDLTLERLVEIRNIHSQHILADMAISDTVIESYYHAFPRRFLMEGPEQEPVVNEDDNDQAVIEEENYLASNEVQEEQAKEQELPCPQISRDQLLPLDDVLRAYIADIIYGQKRASFLRKENQRLLEEYNVEFLI